jgi:serine/threonine-protein kinase
MSQPAVVRAQTLQPGTVIAERYRIEQLIGEGAMGTVYRVEHVHMHQRFALKILGEALGDNEELVARFEREAMATANIDHPNVATATDFGRTTEGASFLVLELVQGESLRHIVERGRLPVARAISIAVQIGRALAKAHSLGIVHRDLKPENVMLVTREDGSELVKVLDFGIAKMPTHPRASSAQPLTRLGAIIGTPHYMAPEQALGEAVNSAADLYAVGVILFEMLTGKRPFDHEDVLKVMGMHLASAPPPLRASAPDIPEPVEAIVARLLEKQPEARFRTAADLLAALEAVCDASRPRTSLPTSEGVIGESHARVSTHRTSRTPAPACAPTVLVAAGKEPTPPRSGRWAAIVDWARPRVQALAAWAMPRLSALYARVRASYDWIRASVPVQARPAVPWVLGGVGLLLVVGPMCIVLFPGRRGAQEMPRTHAAPESPGLSDAHLREVSSAGAAALEQLAREFPDDARVQRELVRTHTSDGHGAAAMRALGRLLALDPTATGDPEITEALHAALDGTFDASAAAIRVAEGPFGERGVDILFDCATMTGPAKERCKEALLKPDVRAHASRATRVALDLNDTTECESKHAAVLRAVDDGDNRALTALRALLKRGGCGRRGRQNCWPCLRLDGAVERAISAIEARGAGPSSR